MMAFAALRSGVLSHIRIPVSTGAAQQLAAPLTTLWARTFAGESTYLDKKEVTDRVLEIVKNFEKVDASKVSPTANFQKDLGLDSLDTVELVMALEEEFAVEIPDSEADKITSTSEAIDYLASHPQAK